MKKLFFAAGFFFLVMIARGAPPARAESLVVHDATTIWGASILNTPIFAPFRLSPPFVQYHAAKPFIIQKINIGANDDGSSNNHNLAGNVRAWIYSADGAPIASSTNTCYGEGGCTGRDLLFSGATIIPQDFQLGFITDDGLQAIAAFSIRDVSIFGADPPVVREPLVIVPGMMGAVLSRTANGSEVWPSLSNMVLPNDAYLDELALDPSGNEIAGRAMTTTDIFRDASLFGVISQSIYGNLIRRFIAEGYEEGKDLFVAPYDWRRSIESQIPLLDAKIAAARNASADGKIIILAHSMGGLLVKADLAARSDASFIDKLVLVGVPQLGAPQAFKTLQYGDDEGIPILNGDEVKKISANMPSAYELLPSRRYMTVAGGYVQDFRNGGAAVLGYASTTQSLPNQTLAAAADAFHAPLDEAAVQAPQIYNIVGCFLPTTTGFNLYDGGVVDLERGNGDGTVPQVSAMNLANGFNNFFVLGNETGIDHMGLVNDARSLALVDDIVNAAATTTAFLQGVSTSTADCFTPRAGASDGTMIEIGVHGPASLDVFDDAGNHTGFDANGDIELGVPFSTFAEIDDNTFITVPAGKKIRAIAKPKISSAATSTPASATSTTPSAKKATVKVRKVTPVKTKKVTTFVDVPLTTPSTTVQLDILDATSTPDVSTTTLTVDVDGDGMPDQTIPPAIVVDPGTEDIVPPVIVVPNIPTSTIIGSSITFSWAVTDAGSGVATTSAALDGRAIQNDERVRFGQLGAHTFRIESIDRAGNPAVLTRTIQVLAGRVNERGHGTDKDKNKGKGKGKNKDHKDKDDYGENKGNGKGKDSNKVK